MSSIDVQKIADLAVAAQAATQAKTVCPTLTLPRDFQIIDLEPFLELRNFYRGVFSTNRIKDFVAYYARFKTDETPCFVDPDAMSATTLFDLGTVEAPGHCNHRAELELTTTTAYQKGILATIDKQYSQRDLFNYLQDWKNHIIVIDANGDDMDHAHAAQTLLKIDIKRSLNSSHEESDYSQSKSTMAKIEAQATDGKQLPRGIRFICKPYDSLKEYEFFLRLSLHQSRHEETPTLKLRCEALENLQDDMRDEFTQLLTQNIPNVLIGSFKS